MIFIFLSSPYVFGTTLNSVDKALRESFSHSITFIKKSLYLTNKQTSHLKEQHKIVIDSRLIPRYKISRDQQTIAYAYIDTHRVRTLDETILVVIDLKNKIKRIEIISFSEPLEYLPNERWLQQFYGIKKMSRLYVGKEIHPMIGSSLTADAVTSSVRRIHLIHQLVNK